MQNDFLKMSKRVVWDWVLALKCQDQAECMQRLRQLAQDPQALAALYEEDVEDPDMPGDAVDLVHWAILHKVKYASIAFLLNEAGAIATHSALIAAAIDWRWEVVTLLYENGARFRRRSSLLRYVRDGAPEDLRNLIIWDHRSLWGKDTPPCDSECQLCPFHLFKRFAAAQRATVAILALKRKHPKRELKDVWPIIARHMWFPAQQRLDACWHRVPWTLKASRWINRWGPYLCVYAGILLFVLSLRYEWFGICPFVTDMCQAVQLIFQLVDRLIPIPI